MDFVKKLQALNARVYRRLQITRDELFMDEFGNRNRNYAFWTKRFWNGED